MHWHNSFLRLHYFIFLFLFLMSYRAMIDYRILISLFLRFLIPWKNKYTVFPNDKINNAFSPSWKSKCQPRSLWCSSSVLTLGNSSSSPPMLQYHNCEGLVGYPRLQSTPHPIVLSSSLLAFVAANRGGLLT